MKLDLFRLLNVTTLRVSYKRAKIDDSLVEFDGSRFSIESKRRDLTARVRET